MLAAHAGLVERGFLLGRELVVERRQRGQALLHFVFTQLGPFDHLAQTFRCRQLGNFAAWRTFPRARSRLDR